MFLLRPVSNPINIIVLSAFPLDLWTFLHLLFEEMSNHSGVFPY